MDKFELVVMRLRVGIKQYQLAALLDVPQTTICDLEKGRRHITPEIERRIEKAINEAKNRKTTVSRK